MASKSSVDMKTTQNYDVWTREELINRLRELDASVLKTDLRQKPQKKCKKRIFSWDNVSKRHILLKFLYFGWEYHGYASQVDTKETVEEYLINAMKQCCLIQDRERSNYHRCGRTDAGVSAVCQVVSIDVRSKLKEPDASNTGYELEYCKMLNRLLPIYIRCYAWCHVGSEVSARFDCSSRSYNYFFPKGNLNIQAMSTAAKYLEGTHDFRNLCKMDVGNGVVEFTRTVDEAYITAVNEEKSAFQMMKFIVRSRGFLWHQIRCIMAVLLLVGEGNESPSIIADLLDIHRHPCKPQYHMASALPLSLSRAEYHGHTLVWNSSPEEIQYLCGQLQGLWTDFAVKEAMVRDALALINSLSTECTWQRQIGLYTGVLPKSHVPLLKRPKCNSLEDRMISVERRKKRKIEEMGGCG